MPAYRLELLYVEVSDTTNLNRDLQLTTKSFSSITNTVQNPQINVYRCQVAKNTILPEMRVYFNILPFWTKFGTLPHFNLLMMW